MTAAHDSFDTWLQQASRRPHLLTTEQRGLLRAAFAFRHNQGNDYYSSLLGHFLLHCNSGLKIAHIARLGCCSRQTASQ